MVTVKLSWLLIVIGLALIPLGARAQYGCGADPYANYTYFEACHAFLDGDQNIEGERWDIDFSTCLDRWPELSEGDN